MPSKCAVIGCSNRAERERDKRFFRVPAVIKSQGEHAEELSRKRRAKWFSNISRADLDVKKDWIRVCSDHFITGRPSKLYPEDSIDWAPTLNLGHNKLKSNTELSLKRHERAVRRQEKRRETAAVEALMALRDLTSDRADVEITKTGDVETKASSSLGALPTGYSAALPETVCSPCGTEVQCQTDLTVEAISKMEESLHRIENDNKYLNEQLYGLRERLIDADFSEDSLKGKDEQVRFYTGLANFQMLMALFKFLAPYISATHRSAVNKFTEFMITLMRLRLNLSSQDLAYRFKISDSTVSRIFEKWIDVMELRLGHIILWPDRETLQKTMPLDFKQKFKDKVAVILDCFEIFVDRPSSLSARAASWSHNKHHNTVKFLMGITPQGTISFISNAWGGRVSDKHITENCGVLSNLLPGDIVLSDRGFTIEDSVGFFCAELDVPAFTKGKSQLLPMDVFRTRKIASVRIHVERVIGLVRRKYLILQGTLAIRLLTVSPGQVDAPIDKIARVCCALTNLANSVVPFGD